MPFDDHLARWGLTPDGEPIATRSSDLLPVRRAGVPAMLKIAREAEERWGGHLMSWWGGDGAARVLAQDGAALLLERATGERSLVEMARGGRDDEASRIICAVAARLHAPRGCPPPALIPLPRWFEALEPAAARHGGILSLAAASARELLAAPQEVVVLHGDLHHGNVLDFGGAAGSRSTPSASWASAASISRTCSAIPTSRSRPRPGVWRAQASVVAEAAGLDRPRLLRWILAWAGLSAAWHLEDGETAETALAVARLAAAEIAR